MMKLTFADGALKGEPLWINPAHVVAVWKWQGTTIVQTTGTDEDQQSSIFHVEQTPEYVSDAADGEHHD